MSAAAQARSNIRTPPPQTEVPFANATNAPPSRPNDAQTAPPPSAAPGKPRWENKRPPSARQSIPAKVHCHTVRDPRVRSQYQRNNATVNAECACDHDGLKYMYTGSELASQMPIVARNAQRSRTYFLASRKKTKALENRKPLSRRPWQPDMALKIRPQEYVRRMHPRSKPGDAQKSETAPIASPDQR